MIFAEPLFLIALFAIPLLAALEALGTRRDQRRLGRFVGRPLWPRVLRRPHPRWRFVRLGLLLLGAAGIALALARPQWGIVREKVEREGVDVVLLLDSSGSMATPDVAPSRFFLARAALTSLVGRLEGDRFGLVAFEGDAYPLVPLTLDADAIGLFLDTVEPGLVPSPGTSLGRGLSRGLDLFVDSGRTNRVMVLVSDGEDLEGEVETAVKQAKAAGVIVHAVGVGTEKGEPVPDLDAEGRAVGFKKDESGRVVVSRLNTATLEAIARGTGGRFFRLNPADTSLKGLAAAIEGMEERTLAREFSYRRKERYQVPLAISLFSVGLALLVPPPPFLRRRATRQRTPAVAAGIALALALVSPLGAQTPRPSAPPREPPPASPLPSRLVDEVLLRPRRFNEQGRTEYGQGNHPQSLDAFTRAGEARPGDPALRFNVADGLYKNGRFDEAASLYRSLGSDPASPLAAASRFNLGNTLFQKQDYRGALQAYRDALRLRRDDQDALRNLELALRALKEQEERQQQRNPPNRDDQPKGDEKDKQKQQPPPGERKEPQPAPAPKPKTAEEKEQQRFQQETGMPKDRAMQLLDALQRNEKAEQRKALAAKRGERKGKDW
jgi:Ca-activated chloride channel family protein